MQTATLLPGAQQLGKLATATADGTGKASFSYERPPSGTWWSGSLNCAGAPTGAIFTSLVDATPWGTWGGPTVFGPIQAQAGQQITVTAVGLTPGQQYALAFLGSSDPAGSVQPIAPDANASALLAATTQGSVDLLATNSPTPQSFPHDFWTQIGPFTALHAYSSLIVFLSDQSGGTACPVTFVAAANSQHAFIPYEAQASPFELRFGGAANPNVTFLLPFAAAPGDLIDVEVNPIGTTMPQTLYWVFGATAPLAQTVTNPLGNPIDTSERGGLSRVISNNNNNTVPILVAPAAGTVYRLHRFLMNDAGSGNLLGSTSGFAFGFIGTGAGNPVDNLGGLCSNEGLSVFANRAVQGVLYYDTIPTPTVS